MRRDDSLAHGLAHQLLRELADDVRRAAEHVRKHCQPYLRKTSVRKSTCEFLVEGISEGLDDLALARGVVRDRGAPSVAVWVAAHGAAREGMEIERLAVIFEPPHYRLEILNQTLAFLNDHTIARIFQREPVETRADVLRVLRPLAMGAAFAQFLALRHSWRQWGIPVGDGIVVGHIADDGLLQSDTFLPADSRRWREYLRVMGEAIAGLEQEDEDTRTILLAGAYPVIADVLEPAARPFRRHSLNWLRRPFDGGIAGRDDRRD